MDLACSIALGLVLAVLGAAYAARVARAGRVHTARVEAEGKSALVSSELMEMLYWCARPLVAACVRLRLTPDAVTAASLGLGVAAGVALAAGHFGLGALLATAAGACDAIDGVLARQLGTSSVAGEVLDAATDRYVDFALLGGLAFYFRDRAPMLLLALLALLAAFMVSYSTAKAEALHVVPPRGSMRRVERVMLVIVAAALAPVAARLGTSWKEAPILVAIGLIAVVGNESAVRRLVVLRARLREREAPRPDEASLPKGTPGEAE
ncbi:MAG TPA: CDP-alcohol phosphatidyltransferase family protein [Labilithrix sp.]|nr:CDP-alcohol phosphatidyltransferase family protein [Labilithrix sp.]